MKKKRQGYCSKKRFDNKYAAMRAIERLNAIGVKVRRYYYCRPCHAYHITKREE